MGFRAGQALVASLEFKATDLNNFPDIFTQLWAESGLSRAKVIKANDGEIVVTFDESLEASHGRRCDFTRGYLAGMTSSLLGRKYTASEVICASQGAERCVHHLTPVSAPMKGTVLEPVIRERRFKLESGCSYLIESEDPKQAFDIFEECLLHGNPGLCVVREYPEKLKSKYRLDGSQVLWLSYESNIQSAREPTNIPLIYSEMKSFIESNESAVIMVSGLEYMVSQTNFPKVLKFVQLLSESTAVTDSIFLLPISPQALNNREVKLLEREFRDINAVQPGNGHAEEIKEEGWEMIDDDHERSQAGDGDPPAIVLNEKKWIV